MKYTILDCTTEDLRIMARRMRPEDRLEVTAVQMPPGRFLRKLWMDSSMRRCARVDGEVAAVWGTQGSLLDSEVSGWLFTTAVIERIPLTFFREARREMEELLTHHRTVTTGVLSSYYKSIRFWSMIGFSRTGTYHVNGTEFVRLTMGHD